ncbi:hypothetical protein [Brevibacillus sp. H7]|jgi:hypothetical protein|uniref:hypothetical protein n=1 Tax=Brevibacillus sp. H7 TaxID=3349138 RepID=UPI003823C078
MKKDLTKAVNRVEEAFWTIVFSARKRVGDRGVLLPVRFNSMGKIRRFLSKSMSPCLARRLIKNLQLRRIGGKLAIPLGDGIGAPPIQRVRVLSKSTRCATVAVWFAFDQDDRFSRIYQLRKKRSRWIVFGRHPLDFPFN